MPENRGSIHISGSGKVSGGVYDDIHVSGSGHINGDCEAVTVQVSGSAHFNGSLRVENKLHCSGSCHLDGALNAGEVHSSGSFNVSAPAAIGALHCSGSFHSVDVTAEEFQTSGSAHINGALAAKRLNCSGSLYASEGVESENACISGKADVKGLFNANRLEIKLHGRSSSYIEEIGCDTLSVHLHRESILSLFGVRPGTLRTGTVEGNDIDIEYTEANIIRGARVVIGEGCEIKRVEYTESLTVNPAARVGEQVKV